MTTIGFANLVKMTQQEQRRVAQQLADVSDVFNFETALGLVELEPAKAEELLRMRAENKQRQEERARAYEGLRQAIREFR
jgi:hypothetical protein